MMAREHIPDPVARSKAEAMSTFCNDLRATERLVVGRPNGNDKHVVNGFATLRLRCRISVQLIAAVLPQSIRPLGEPADSWVETCPV